MERESHEDIKKGRPEAPEALDQIASKYVGHDVIRSSLFEFTAR